MYYVYILRCEDGSLYSGITTDLKRRFRQHAGELSGGAKYTARRKPVRFETVFSAPDRAAASRLEYRLKKLSHSEKEALLRGMMPTELELCGCERTAIEDGEH